MLQTCQVLPILLDVSCVSARRCRLHFQHFSFYNNVKSFKLGAISEFKQHKISSLHYKKKGKGKQGIILTHYCMSGVVLPLGSPGTSGLDFLPPKPRG